MLPFSRQQSIMASNLKSSIYIKSNSLKLVNINDDDDGDDDGIHNDGVHYDDTHNRGIDHYDHVLHSGGIQNYDAYIYNEGYNLNIDSDTVENTSFELGRVDFIPRLESGCLYIQVNEPTSRCYHVSMAAVCSSTAGERRIAKKALLGASL